MKRLLPLLLSCFLLLETTAQDAFVQKYEYNQNDFQKRFSNKGNSSTLNDSNFVFHDFSLKGKKPGVYRLPQDNMPCIVPDSTKTVRMPNAWKGSKRIPYQSNPPRIPNLSQQWKPYPIANEDSNTK